jgi:hypothetical protein
MKVSIPHHALQTIPLQVPNFASLGRIKDMSQEFQSGSEHLGPSFPSSPHIDSIISSHGGQQ